jgi:hypothetical protein
MRIDCICPPKAGAVRHPDGDEITFKKALDFKSMAIIRWEIAIRQARDPKASLAEHFGAVTELYVLYGVESWTLVDAKGQPIDVSTSEIRERLLPSAQAQAIGDQADQTYQAVMLPLLLQGSPSSPPTPTDESTSPKTDDSESQTASEENSKSSSSPTRQKPSKQSSISTIPTAATATTTTSLDGDSNSSQSSTSAA